MNGGHSNSNISLLNLTGIHYHYNISTDLDCEKALPLFLLFSPQSQSLIGFGWGGPFVVSSAEWEKPPPSLFAVSLIDRSWGEGGGVIK